MNDSKYPSFCYLSFLFILVLILGYVNGSGVGWADSQPEPAPAVSASPCPSPTIDISGWGENKISLPEGTLHIRLPEGWQNLARLPQFYPRGEKGATAIEADFWKRGNDYFFQWIQNQDTLPIRESRLPEEVEPSQYAQCEETLEGRKVVIETRLLAAKDPDKSQTHIFYQAAVTFPVPTGKWLVISGTLKSRPTQEQLLHSFRTIRIKN
jgi:hypothetical protein